MLPQSPRAMSNAQDNALPTDASHVAVIVPCYRVTAKVLDVLRRIGPECARIYVVDDACPDGTGDLVERECTDPRVRVLRNERNLGVGGAVLRGYTAALEEGATILVKIDGDGQMAPELLPSFLEPILRGEADYTKGNRFHDMGHLRQMPVVRVLGNAALTFMTKISAGYWHLFDPTNGYTALHAEVARELPLDSISHSYFFETDILFRLNVARAVVVDVPMASRYGDETSHLNVGRVLPEFLFKHARNTVKRLFYNYFLRDFSLASLELIFGPVFITFGVVYGAVNWIASYEARTQTPAGTVMLSALPVLMGFQLLLAFVGHDVASSPTHPVHHALAARRRLASGA